MKLNIKTLLFGALAASTMLTACDNIAEDDRFIPVERPHSDKVVLMWKFTGQRCIYCPGGDQVIEQLHNAYGHNFIAVGLHPQDDPFTRPLHKLDLTCAAASEYKAYYNPKTFPYAIIDGNPDMQSSVTAQWGSFVKEQMSVTAPADLRITTVYDPSDRNVTINYTVLFNDPLPAGTPCNLQLWIMENGIVGSQMQADGTTDRNYVHNHVLRDAINGYWGQTLNIDGSTLTPIIPTTEFQGEVKYQVNDAWVAENCQIVAFIFNEQTKYIWQAALADVIATE